MAVNGHELAFGQHWYTADHTLVELVQVEHYARKLIFKGSNDTVYNEDGIAFTASPALREAKRLTYLKEGTFPQVPVERRSNQKPPHRSSQPAQPAQSAPDLLNAAAGHMRDRAATYDKPEGERSMASAVAAFNAQTGRDLSESEGWLLLGNLKLVRDRQRNLPHRDSIEDGIAYFALHGEARLKEEVRHG